MEMAEKSPKNLGDNESLKMAIAMALVRSKLTHTNQPRPLSLSSFDPLSKDALKWKRKAKERKLEIARLKEDIKISGMQQDLFPHNALCKCYFFDNLGQFSSTRAGDDCDHRFNDVLYRSFLRQVRINERKRKLPDGSKGQEYVSEYSNNSEVEKLRASVDFLVDTCHALSQARLDECKFKNWSHQAVGFILDAVKTKSAVGDNIHVEGVLSSLITCLLQSMCSATREEHQADTDVRFYIQHLMRKLGSDCFIGQCILLSASQRISLVAEGFLFMDPFHDAFLKMHHSIYLMIQLIEFLVSDYLLTWSGSEEFDTRRFEEWIVTVLEARKVLELMECRSGLYVLYMDRVIGLVAKQVGQSSFLQMLNPEILANLFR
ncbi:hypothetical protein DM860_005373 [Cuscuta australis]|uniref:Protein MULTIPOLAR SPINDLE 1 n=1 Tax=Cuscuta australis TaxID=267555 RepID=A0A328DZA0_9ASTE|nr:hypothetical protein DM860_005373 [Cuscuta australis]